MANASEPALVRWPMKKRVEFISRLGVSPKQLSGLMDKVPPPPSPSPPLLPSPLSRRTPESRACVRARVYVYVFGEGWVGCWKDLGGHGGGSSSAPILGQ